ncbi:MAG: terminase small subunit [Candidatus Thorarchaeota archaeon]|jgi:hypothetical protein
MSVGRPSKYKPEYCEQLVEFFDRQPYEFVLSDESDETSKKIKQICDLPTLAAFAKTVGVHRDTIHQWSKDHSDFSDAIKKAKELQEDILITNGLHGNYNTAFAIFTAKNVIGWRDKQELEHTGKDGGAIELESADDMDIARRVAFLLTSGAEYATH